jgi:hypothetical protein
MKSSVLAPELLMLVFFKEFIHFSAIILRIGGSPGVLGGLTDAEAMKNPPRALRSIS